MLWSLVVGLSLAAPGPRQVVEAAKFQGEVLIARRGRIEHHFALGLANPATKAPHRVGQVWRWASITKQLMAVLVMQEVERGHLSLESTLREVLPAFTGPTRDVVTVRMLLQHTSGLPNPHDTAPSRDGGFPEFYEQAQPQAALGFCAGPSASVEVGQRFSYNNCDYLVLGAILDNVSQQPTAVLVKKRLVGPLRLRSLKTTVQSEVVGLIDGVPEPQFVLDSFGASAAWGGTLEDLFRFDEALRTGKLLSSRSLAELWKGVPSLGYEALGQWSYEASVAGCKDPVHLVERRGELGGILVANLMVPEQAVDVLLFSNRDETVWGDVWQGKGLLHDVLSATLCGNK
jgi:D-alanyl-D-alanine carboxypeptidase